MQTELDGELTTENNTDKTAVTDYIVAIVMEYFLTQHTLSKRLKIFGTQGEKATHKDLHQLHDLHNFEQVGINSFSEDE